MEIKHPPLKSGRSELIYFNNKNDNFRPNCMFDVTTNRNIINTNINIFESGTENNDYKAPHTPNTSKKQRKERDLSFYKTLRHQISRISYADNAYFKAQLPRSLPPKIGNLKIFSPKILLWQANRENLYAPILQSDQINNI